MKYSLRNTFLPTTGMDRKGFPSGFIAKGASILCVASLLWISSIPIQQGWNNTDMLLCVVIAVLAMVGMAMCLLTKSKLIFGRTDFLIVALYGYFIIRYFLDATYPATAMAVHATLSFLLYFSLRTVFSGSRLNGNVLVMLILAYAAYEAGYGIVQLIKGTSLHYQYAVTGSFHNPGPYSASLVVGLVIICTYMKNSGMTGCPGIPPKWNTVASIAIQSFAMLFIALIIITVSRTAVIAAALCLFILFWGRLGRWKWPVMGGCIALGAALYFIKSGSADGRAAINYVGTYAMASNPVFGSGAGSFFHRFAETTRMMTQSWENLSLRDVDVIEYAFNDWLRIAVELGATGTILAAAVAVWALKKLWKSNVPLFLSLTVILVFSFFSYPFELLPYRIMAIMIISFAASQGKSATQSYKRNGRGIAVSVIVAVGIAGGCMIQASRVRSLVEAEEDYDMMRGIDDQALIKDYERLLPLLEDNRNFLFDYGRLLSKAGRMNDSNFILRRGAMISNDPMFIVVQGNNYRDMGAFDESREMYLNAWHTMPNRIYPLYRLMLLYEQTGEDAMAMEYARIIVNFKEKVPSPAVCDIKKEALELIDCK